VPASLTELRRLAPYYGYRAGAALARALPATVALALARAASRVVAPRLGTRRATSRAHLRRVHGEGISEEALDRAVEATWRSYARYWVEAFRISAMSRAELEAGMSWEGVGHVEDALAAGRGAILAMPHLGGWDYGGAWFAATGYPSTVVVEMIEPPELFEFFREMRRGFGVDVVPLDKDAGAAILGALRRGGMIGLVCDRDINRTGIPVELFGAPTTLPAGPATLALRTGAVLLPTAVYFGDDGQHRGVVRPPISTERTGKLRDDVAVVTQELADELEHLIRLAPEQWHVFQPNWPDLEGR